MPTFTYTARNLKGEMITGVLTADSYQQVLRSLDEQSLFPMDVHEGGKATRASGRKKKVRMTAMSVFYQQFADLLKAGVPALRSLDVLQRQTSNAVLKETLQEVRTELSSGQTLAEAMEKHPNAFNPLHVSMISAGEKGGFLEEVLYRISTFTERQNELRNKLIGAMLYPAVLMVVGISIVTFLLVSVVPKIRDLLMSGDLPTMTKVVFWMCDFLKLNGLYLLGGVTAAVFLIVGFFRSEAGRWWLDRIQLRMPMFGPITTLVAICRFCRILGTLLQNGVPILQSLKISRDSAGNRLLSELIDNATESVRKGASLAQPLGKSDLFPLDVVDMIAVGEESNNLENVLINIADSYEARTGRKIDLMVRMLEPMLLVGMAGVVAFIAIALLLPILTMSSNAVK